MIRRLIDLHVSTDEVSFVDAWQNGTGVSLHLGKYRLDLCRPQRTHRGSPEARHTSQHAQNPRGCRDSPRP